jgi:hypothetical protein
MTRTVVVTVMVSTLLIGCGSAARKVYIPEPAGDVIYKPRFFQFSVDGGDMWKVKRWVTYGSTNAEAIAGTSTNDCEPSCADGHIRTATLTIRLGRVQRCSGVDAFTELVVLQSSDEKVARRGEHRDLRPLCR